MAESASRGGTGSARRRSKVASPAAPSSQRHLASNRPALAARSARPKSAAPLASSERYGSKPGVTEKRTITASSESPSIGTWPLWLIIACTKPSMASRRCQYGAPKSLPSARAARPQSNIMSATSWWYQMPCSRFTPSAPFCSSASRSKPPCASACQRALCGQHGQVMAAMCRPMYSPSKWLLADECREKCPAMKWQWRYTSSSQRCRNACPGAPLKTLPAAPPPPCGGASRICQATDQLTSRTACSSELVQCGPSGYGLSANQLSSRVLAASAKRASPLRCQACARVTSSRCRLGSQRYLMSPTMRSSR